MKFSCSRKLQLFALVLGEWENNERKQKEWRKKTKKNTKIVGEFSNPIYTNPTKLWFGMASKPEILLNFDSCWFEVIKIDWSSLTLTENWWKPINVIIESSKSKSTTRFMKTGFNDKYFAGKVRQNTPQIEYPPKVPQILPPTQGICPRSISNMTQHPSLRKVSSSFSSDWGVQKVLNARRGGQEAPKVAPRKFGLLCP